MQKYCSLLGQVKRAGTSVCFPVHWSYCWQCPTLKLAVLWPNLSGSLISYFCSGREGATAPVTQRRFWGSWIEPSCPPLHRKEHPEEMSSPCRRLQNIMSVQKAKALFFNKPVTRTKCFFGDRDLGVKKNKDRYVRYCITKCKTCREHLPQGSTHPSWSQIWSLPTIEEFQTNW